MITYNFMINLSHELQNQNKTFECTQMYLVFYQLLNKKDGNKNNFSLKQARTF